MASFEQREVARDLIRQLEDARPAMVGGGWNTDRIPTAILMLADGSRERFEEALEAACLDWRDVLMWSGLAHADWGDKVGDYLDQP